MMCRMKISKSVLAIIAVSLISACSTDTATKSSTCSAFDTTQQSTEYSARLVRPDRLRATEMYDETGDSSESYQLQIQAVHPKTMASPIRRISLNDGTTPALRLLDDNCVCGMQIRKADVECTHITTYHADISEQTLIAVQNKGLAMTFTLENGRIVAGPMIPSEEINKVMLRP